MNNFWISNSLAYTALDHDSLGSSLHPAIVRILEQRRATELLDYGCGDGRFLASVPSTVRLSAYDISPAMLDQTRERLRTRVASYYTSAEDIPADHFDVVVCSMVLVCVADKKSFETVVDNIYRSLAPGGAAVVAVTHPCFRQALFSDFRTSFTEGREFNYFRNGESFEVKITDSSTGNRVNFDDYHWNLSFTLNEIIKSGFVVAEVVEIEDDPKSKSRNSLVPPFLIIVVEKH